MQPPPLNRVLGCRWSYTPAAPFPKVLSGKWEVSGGLGDLGTLIPILVSLSVTNQISLTASLVFGGLWNILTGLHFRIPMCVQPMKAIAAMALSKPLTFHEVMGAGIGVGTVVFLLGATRTIRLVTHYTPYSVIKGIQLGTGVVLMTKAVDLVQRNPQWGGSEWRWNDNIEWALASFILVFALYRRARFPTALVLFLVGLTIALVWVCLPGGTNQQLPRLGFYYPRLDLVTWPNIVEGFLTAGLGQLPLTLLNSGVAVCALAAELFPDHPASIEHITMSVGLMNVVGCLFGSVPYCHGSGGLAGQYHFGARSEVSVLVLGTAKLLLGLFMGGSLVSLFQVFPNSILGVMLFISGSELALAARRYSRHLPESASPDAEDQRARDFVIMMVTAGLIIGFRNDAVGFLGGILFWFRGTPRPRGALPAKHPDWGFAYDH
ncbi:hypothetical protein BJ085DRAFT_42406 [Dimargaris cristalligena]|uniref:Sulfate transporter family-domain-containing protein n=1 Tax=Dimargaris cristalligena TaxID=215637 RepID=A0A4P9ZXA9_9FUNG|nr:hypothetical protein BJ085DRAFT_42406 [Dimargaris cristalligena]|eukprot:RKP38306.1 hypothetical protein BJ085DRAFT_42406 [Dimargaris cristalligena]